MGKRLLQAKEASAFLDDHGYTTSAATLNKMACLGGGPMFRKFGRFRVYTEDDLLAWANGRLSEAMRSTSEYRVNSSDNDALDQQGDDGKLSAKTASRVEYLPPKRRR